MPDVTVLMVLRGANASRLSWHGSPWVAMPCLDRLVAQATVFDRHYSPVTNKNEAMATILPESLIQALHDHGHGLVWIAAQEQIVPEMFQQIPMDSGDEKAWVQAFVAAQSRIHGKSALIVVDLPFAEPPWILRSQERDLYFPAARKELAINDDNLNPEGPPQKAPEMVDGYEGDEASDEFVDALPWEEEIPESVGAEDDLTHLRLIETHAAAIGHSDAIAGAIIAQIPARMALLVLGDCGIELGDHGATGDSNPFPWISRVNVPCIWHNPAGDGVPRRVLTLSSHHDVATTIAQRFLLELPDLSIGMDLTELAVADASGNINRSVVSIGKDGFCAIRTLDWSLMVSDIGKASLYSLPDDPWEVLDLASQREEVVAELLRLLEKIQFGQAGDLAGGPTQRSAAE